MQRHFLRLALIALMIGAHAAPARADAFTYTFTGNVGQSYSAVNLGDEWISLAGAPFTISGVIGERCCTSGPGWGAWETIPTYDFGALGSFTMDPAENQGITRFLQLGLNGVDYVSLDLWFLGTIDFQGVAAAIPHVAGDAALLQAFATATTLSSGSGRQWLMTNVAGQQLRWGNDCPNCPRTSVTSVKVEPVPEPSTLILISIGLGVAIRHRRLRY